MRISKPKGQTADYKLYNTIALRDADKENLINGQEVKVLNASGDPAIKSGWAIYKYDKESNLFDLLEKQESDLPDYKLYANIKKRSADARNLKDGQEVKVLDASDDPAIKSGWAVYKYSKTYRSFDLIGKQEKDLQIGADERTVNSKLGTLPMFNAPELQNPYHENIRIMQDFDVTAEVDDSTKKILLKINGSLTENVSIPLRTPNGMKYLKLKGMSLPRALFNTDLYGKPVYIGISAHIRDTDGETISGMQYTVFPDGSPIKNVPGDVVADTVFPLLQIRFDIPLQSFGAWNNNMLTVIRHWKRILAPAEERIIIPAISETTEVLTDDYTIYKAVVSEKLRMLVPEGFVTHPSNFRILEDFNYSIEEGNQGNAFIFRLEGADRTVKLIHNGLTRYMSIASESVLFNLYGGGGKGRYVHAEITATISDDPNTIYPMGTAYNSSGEVLISKPIADPDNITIMQARIYIPNNGESWDDGKCHIWKYWKKALAPFDELFLNYKQRNP